MTVPLTRRQNILVRLVAVPVAAGVASHVVFSPVFPGQAGYQFPWAYFLTVVTVMLSVWEVNQAVYQWLDERLPFGQHPVRRLINQILLGGTATLCVFAVVFPLAQRLYTHHWPPVPTVLRGLTVCVTLASLVNGGYCGLYLLGAFLAERQKKTSQDSTERQLKPSDGNPSFLTPALLPVDVSNGQLRLPIDQIAYFYSAGGLVLLVKTDGQQVVTRYSSFAQLIPALNERSFFQLSRQFIVSLGAVRAVQDDVNRKLIVTVAPALHRQQPHQNVVVSRYRSLELKKWLKTSVDQ